MSHNLAVISVIYENYNILQDFIGSCQNQINNNFYLFIADLSPNQKQINLPKFAKIINGQNKGYAYGINLCLKQAINEGFNRFAVINSDTRLDSNMVGNTLQSLKKNPKSIIGAKIYYEKGFEYHKDRYNQNKLGKIIWYAGGYVDWKNVYTVHRGVDEVDLYQYNQFEKTDFITGCFMAFDKAVITSIGFWDEKYFLYYEDADYCEKAKRKNINLYYDPSIIIWHKNAQSTGGSGSKLHEKYQEKNRLIFGLKYAPFKTKFHLIKNQLLKRACLT